MKMTLSSEQLENIKARALAAADEPVQALEFTAAEMNLGIDIDLDMDFNALPPVLDKPGPPVARAPFPGTKKMCIRMPNTIIRVFKVEAKRKGVPYQTLMIRALKEASKGR